MAFMSNRAMPPFLTDSGCPFGRVPNSINSFAAFAAAPERQNVIGSGPRQSGSQALEEPGSMTSDAIAADSHHARESDDSKMAQILDQLGSGKGLPVDAIRAANADRAAMVPVMLRAFDDCAAAGPSLQNALFFAFHLLGQWREKSAYRPLAAFLRRPTEETDRILGGATTGTAHRVMASIFDGDPKVLYEVILEPTVDEFIRARMCAALAMVTLRGELPREEAARFLQSCYDSLQPQDECYVWDGWQGAIAMLGLSELKPLVKQAFERGFISPGWLGFEDFEQDLQCTIDGKVPPSWAKNEFELFGDTIDELSSWHAFAPKRKQARRLDGVWRPRPTPATDKFKGVGRNDPCPCGSGKKFKKCCLDSMRFD